MGLEQVAIVLAGALAGGIVNGLTGFGTAITALGIWVYGIPPAPAASLSIICAAVSQTQAANLVFLVRKPNENKGLVLNSSA